MTRIASGYAHEQNDAALVVGPTGLAYDAERDILYVASTDDNAIYAIRNAGQTDRDRGTGRIIYQDRRASARAARPGAGAQRRSDRGQRRRGQRRRRSAQRTRRVHHRRPVRGQFSIDPGAGAAFGLALQVTDNGLRFAAVNDNTNSVDIWTFDTNSPF